MFPIDKKIRQSNYNLWTLPEDSIPKDILPEDDLLELLNNIRNGEDSEESIQKIILSHARLALSIVGRYLTQYNCKSLSDDLNSSALLGLTVGANKLATLKHDNVTGFLVLYIHNYIIDYIRKSSTVYIPAKQKNIPVVTIHGLQLEHKNHFNKEEWLEELTKSKTERKIADLKIKGYSTSEIAELLKVSLPQVYLVRKRIKDRFDERRKNL